MIKKNIFRRLFVFCIPFGGGYIDDLLGDGLYSIKAFANLSIFQAHESAAETFQRRANILCKNGYQEINIVVDSYAVQKSALVWLPQGKAVIPVQTKGLRVTSKIGYVQCLDSKLNREEVEKIIIPERN
jgi:hypothetical protein